jgi:peroxiredoxin
MLNVGETIPENIELLDQDGVVRKLAEFKGHRTVYYTYP